MSEILFVYDLTEDVMRAEAIASGKYDCSTRKTYVQLDELQVEVRQALVPLCVAEYVSDHGTVLKADLTSRYRPDEPKLRDSLSVGNWYGTDRVVQSQSFELHVYAVIAVELLTHNRNVLEQARQRVLEWTAKHTEEYARLLPLVQESAAGSVRNVWIQDEIGAAKWYKFDYAPQDHPSLRDIMAAAKKRSDEEYARRERERKELAEAQAEETKRRMAAERDEWIEAHGSPRLKKCLEEGYDCQRLYVIERAAMEAPGFSVDYFDTAVWKSRSGPSMEALEALDEIREMGIGEPTIVWLTDAPSNTKQRDPEDDGYFEACEAIAVRGYLGKYDLVKIM